MTQQLSHSTDNTVTSMLLFHTSLHNVFVIILAASTHPELKQSIAHANVTALPGTRSLHV